MRDDMNANVAADIYRYLPGRNCGEKSPCGQPKCVLFAKELLKGMLEPTDCPYMKDENRQSVVLILDEYFK
jgi:CO dehydrogenase/acetyl-CoA synthase gamma subunit (corrinoid Fe-S protein)